MSDRLKGLFGGGSSDDEETSEQAEPVVSKRKALGEFSRKVQDLDGDGIPDDEVRENFQTVLREASPETIQRAAAATLQNLPEAKRNELAQLLQDRQQGKNLVNIQRTGEVTAGAAAAGATQSGADQGGDPLSDLLGGLLGGSGGSGGGGGLGDILGGLLGGGASGGSGGGGGLGDILGGLLGGGGSPAAQPSANAGATAGDAGLFDSLGDLLSGPLGKALMAGIAAYAAKEMIDKD